MLFDYVAIARDRQTDRQGQTESGLWLDNFSWQSRCQNFKWCPVGHGRQAEMIRGEREERVHISVP